MSSCGSNLFWRICNTFCLRLAAHSWAKITRIPAEGSQSGLFLAGGQAEVVFKIPPAVIQRQ